MSGADLLKWAGEHWFLTFVAMVLMYGVAWIAFYSLRRSLRALMVVCRGWPPEHLDAEGDWKPNPIEPEKEEQPCA